MRISLLGALVAVAGCDGILEVKLPGQIEADALNDPSQAATMVNSAIADIECAYSAFIATNAGGVEDVYLRATGWWGSLEYQESPGTGECNTIDTSAGWWTPLQAGRYQAELVYERMSEWGAEVANSDQLMAQAAIYAGVSYNLLGDYLCEVAIEAGPLLSPDETLRAAEKWLTTALDHIGRTGDFVVPHGIAPSAREMALALRSRVRFGLGDMQAAATDANQVSAGFRALITRDGGGERTRWNRVYDAHNGNGWATVSGPIDWWEGPGGWPKVIPYTGYRNLGVLPDGRAIEDDPAYPITTHTNPKAVPDPRVRVRDHKTIFNGFPVWTQQKYSDLGADIPLANWEEIWLLLAEIEGGQGAIDRVNQIRRAYELPVVTYLSAQDAAGIERMIIEERRRSLFLEGRFWTTKLRKQLWFPQGSGRTPYPYTYQNAVRMVMPNSEYELNPHFDLSAKGTLCGQQRPVIF